MAICHGSLRKLTETRSQCPAFASLYGSRQSSSSTCFLWICFTELIKFCPHDFPWWLSGKESACNAGDTDLIPGSGRYPGEGNGNPLQYACLEKSHGWKYLAGYSPQGCQQSHTTERLHFRGVLGCRVTDSGQ